MKTQITRTESVMYKIVEEAGERSAEVTFKNGIFDKCDYKVKGCVNSSSTYSYDDWMFLGIVSKNIEKIHTVGWFQKLVTAKTKEKK